MEFEKYENKMKYPEGLVKPFLGRLHTSQEVKEYQIKLDAYEAQLPAYREAKDNYRKENERLLEQFKQDAFKELGVENHPKKEKLWNLAWDKGHSNGLQEVWYELEELSELMI